MTLSKSNAASLALASAIIALGACNSMSTSPGGQAGMPASGVKADADNQSVIDALDRLNFRSLHTLSPAEARTQPTFADGVKEVLRSQGKPTTLPTGVTVRDMTVEGAAGPLPAKVFTPVSGPAQKPLIIYFHGGGFVVADSSVYESSARALARESGAVVVSVDYRRAPEAKFPSQHDDALAAYRWATKNAAAVGADRSRLALAGESAGGNLAVATAIAARAAGLPAPRHILAVYPLAGGDLNTPSYQENANAKPLNRAGMAWFFHHAGRAPTDALDPRISLVTANVSGLPSTTIILAQIDPLRSEGEMLAEHLRTSGVAVEVRTFPGTTHEFFGADAVIADAQLAQEFAGERLKQAFASR
jgi:acetyl esterase